MGDLTRRIMVFGLEERVSALEAQCAELRAVANAHGETVDVVFFCLAQVMAAAGCADAVRVEVLERLTAIRESLVKAGG